VPFDGWSHRALRASAGRLGIPAGEAVALFRGGSADLVAAFSRWADRRMLARLEDAALSELRLSERIELALRLRIETLAPSREAVRRSLSVLALPYNAPLGMLLLYETVDGIWYAVAMPRPISAFTPSARRWPGSWRRRLCTGWRTARLNRPTHWPYQRRLADLHRLTNLLPLPKCRRPHAEPSSAIASATLAAKFNLQRLVSATRQQSRDVAHLAADADAVFAVEMQFCARIIERRAPPSTSRPIRFSSPRRSAARGSQAASRRWPAPIARTGW